MTMRLKTGQFELYIRRSSQVCPPKAARRRAKRLEPKIEETALHLDSDRYTRLCAQFWYRRHAERIAANKRLLGLEFYRGDCHIHTSYSDGRSSVAQIREAAKVAGLDFVFITDHNTTAAKNDCKKFRRVWLGMESMAGPHHLGILGAERDAEPFDSFRQGFLEAAAMPGCLAFLPHPTGWFPTKRYSPKQIRMVYQLDGPFNMEIMNGANQIFDCWDITDARSVELWDKLLCRGKIVYAMGNSDAHLVHGVGSVWNGVFSPRCNKRSVLESLRAGRNFVSDAPVINISAGRAQMGDVVRPRAGSNLTFRIAAADTAGLYQVKLIKNGRVIKRVLGRERKVLRLKHDVRFAGREFYIRAQVAALDGRRAYSNPIFVTG